MTPPNPSCSIRRNFFALILISAFITACSGIPFYEQQGDLDDAIKYYNDNFEAKLLDRSSALVHLDKREDFMTRSTDITNRITFYESKIVNIYLLKEGKPIPINPSFGEGSFDEAIVTIRYQLVVSPSNRLKTLIVKQKWALTNHQWRVYPNLDVFIN